MSGTGGHRGKRQGRVGAGGEVGVGVGWWESPDTSHTASWTTVRNKQEAQTQRQDVEMW